MLRRWGIAVVMLGCGALLFRTFISVSALAAAAVLALYAVLAVAVSPFMAPNRLPAAQAARRRAEDGRAIVYWRPGCPYCLKLRLRLGWRAREAYWVDIWQDPSGAATVRGITGGDETVPTVVVGDQSRVNPAPGWVLARLADPTG